MWFKIVAITVGALALAGSLFGVQYRDQALRAERRHDICVRDQRNYDGTIVYTKFLAKQLDATPEQTASALTELRRVEGPRPVCE